jgi:uncharacterized protein YbjQ (UPF0145 family)
MLLALGDGGGEHGADGDLGVGLGFGAHAIDYGARAPIFPLWCGTEEIMPANEGHPYRVGTEVNEAILVTTSNELEARRIVRYLGVVRGIVVRSPSIGKAFLGAFKQLAGGNIKEYIEVCELARHDAYENMLAHAREIGANAIIGMRYDATEFMQGATEVLAYGTAVIVEER